MTILTKPSNNLLAKESFIKSQSPQLEYEPNEKPRARCPEAKIAIKPDYLGKNISKTTYYTNVFCLFLGFVIMAVIMVGMAMFLYQRLTYTAPPQRHRGVCSVAVPILKNVEDSYRVLPLVTETQYVDTIMDEEKNLIRSIIEELEMRYALSTERIAVVMDGHQVYYLHDFNENTTGIIDDKRCFVTPLNYDVVMSPEEFAAGLQDGSKFDVSPMRINMQGELAAPEDLARMAQEMGVECNNKPVYKLHDSEGSVIRKRSVDEPDPDYIHFSGKHVLELKIDNLPELLENEKKIKSK